MANKYTGPEYPYPCEREWRCMMCNKKFKRWEKNNGTTRRLKLCSQKCHDHRKELIRQGKMESTTVKGQRTSGRETIEEAPDVKVGPRRDVEDIQGPTDYEKKLWG